MVYGVMGLIPGDVPTSPPERLVRTIPEGTVFPCEGGAAKSEKRNGGGSRRAIVRAYRPVSWHVCKGAAMEMTTEKRTA